MIVQPQAVALVCLRTRGVCVSEGKPMVQVDTPDDDGGTAPALGG